MIQRSLPTLAALMTLVACTTTTVRTDFDPTADFTSFETFAFLEPDPFVAAPSGMSPIVLPRIVSATRAALESRGLVMSDDMGAADLIVSFTLGAREESEVSSYPAYYGASSYGDGTYDWGFPYIGQVSLKSYTEGTLAIDIVDREKEAPIWHGLKHKTITEKMRKHPGDAVSDAVAEILAGFPPAPLN